MAKKVRRVKKKKQKQTSIQQSANMADDVMKAVDSTTIQRISSVEQFRLDYAYVVKDLRRVLLLAGAMFALLIILNLLLQ